MSGNRNATGPPVRTGLSVNPEFLGSGTVLVIVDHRWWIIRCVHSGASNDLLSAPGRAAPRDHQWLVETTKDLVPAAGDSVAAQDWAEWFEAGFAYIAGRFGRVEPRRQARAPRAEGRLARVGFGEEG